MLSAPRSMQGRLLVLLLSLVACIWAASALSTWFTVRRQLERTLDGHLAQAGALLVVRETVDLHDHGLDLPRDLEAPAVQPDAPQLAFQVFHADRLAARSANAPAAPMAPLGAGFEAGFSNRQIGGEAWRVHAAQDLDQDLRVLVGERRSARDALLWAVLGSTTWPALLALPMLAAAVWWSLRRGTAPLRALGGQLAQRPPQATEPCRMEDAPTEMLPLLAALNGLFERIGRLRAAEQRFTADAAHELRTPIAAIRTQAQVALDEADGDRRRHALSQTLAGCDRATRLVEQMLTLSRLESGGSPPAAGPVDLSALARQTVAELAPQAIARRQAISLEAPQPCRVTGDPTLLSVLLRNLVDNAIRYSPVRASVQVSVAASADGVRLRVEDSGPGLAPAARQRFGERFFRVLGTGQSGSGLGGSIVHRIAEAHGATVRLGESAELGGLQVEVQWPVPHLALVPAAQAAPARPPSASGRWPGRVGRRLRRSLARPWDHRLRSLQTGLMRLWAPIRVRLAGAAPAGRQAGVSVSLTSHPPRFGTLHLTLLSLLNQSTPPDEVVLWLHAPDAARLPPAVLRLQARGLRIEAVAEDLRVYLKIIPALTRSPGITWVTADDDIYYPPGWLDELVAAHRQDPQAVICRRAHLVHFDADGAPRPYACWTKQTGRPGPDDPLFFTGVGGVLYPPGSLHPDVTRADRFLTLSPDADDIWLNAMARLQGSRVRRIGDTRDPVIWLGSQRVALFRRNRRGPGNDDAVARMVRAYGPGCLRPPAPRAPATDSVAAAAAAA